MKKSTRKTVERLKMYIGQDIVRTRPTQKIGDCSYTDEALTLIGFTPSGEMIVKNPEGSFGARVFGTKPEILPIYFTDTAWITYKKATKAKGNSLNKWKGKRIRRICPTAHVGDRSYMCDFGEKAPTLISASKYHIFIEHNNIGIEGKRSLLRFEFANPNEWELAE